MAWLEAFRKNVLVTFFKKENIQIANRTCYFNLKKVPDINQTRRHGLQVAQLVRQKVVVSELITDFVFKKIKCFY